MIHHHLRASGRQPDRDGPAYAGRCACHHGHPAAQFARVMHACLPGGRYASSPAAEPGRRV